MLRRIVVVIIQEHGQRSRWAALRGLWILKGKGQLEDLVFGDGRRGQLRGIKPRKSQRPTGLDPCCSAIN